MFRNNRLIGIKIREEHERNVFKHGLNTLASLSCKKRARHLFGVNILNMVCVMREDSPTVKCTYLCITNMMLLFCTISSRPNLIRNKSSQLVLFNKILLHNRSCLFRYLNFKVIPNTTIFSATLQITYLRKQNDAVWNGSCQVSYNLKRQTLI